MATSHPNNFSMDRYVNVCRSVRASHLDVLQSETISEPQRAPRPRESKHRAEARRRAIASSLCGGWGDQCRGGDGGIKVQDSRERHGETKLSVVQCSKHRPRCSPFPRAVFIFALVSHTRVIGSSDRAACSGRFTDRFSHLTELKATPQG